MTATVNFHEAKTRLSRLVDQAAKGQDFVAAKAGKPMVRVEPINAVSRRVAPCRAASHPRLSGWSRRRRGRCEEGICQRYRNDVQRAALTSAMLLLDTHLLLWSAFSPGKPFAEATEILQSRESPLAFSMVAL